MHTVDHAEASTATGSSEGTLTFDLSLEPERRGDCALPSDLVAAASAKKDKNKIQSTPGLVPPAWLMVTFRLMARPDRDRNLSFFVKTTLCRRPLSRSDKG